MGRGNTAPNSGLSREPRDYLVRILSVSRFDTGSVPADYAIYGGKDGDIHLVYEGIRKESRSSGKRLWHVTLNPTGVLRASQMLGNGVEHPYLTEMFADPDGKLYVLEVYEAFGGGGVIRGRFGHRVLPLGVSGQDAQPSPHFFVDPWLQLHVVWFESGRPRYMGPTGIPS